jgi:putative ABC transport system permease protein
MPEFREEIRKRLAGLKLEPTREAAIIEEVAQHLEQRYEELRASGASEEAARLAALEELKEGDVLARGLRQVEHQVVFEPPQPGTPTQGNLFADLWNDLRYGVRVLRLNPAFSVIAILSLALGIGANTAIFQLLDAVRLRTLPVENPQELAEVRLAPGSSTSGNSTGGRAMLTNPLWEEIRDHQQAFSGMFAWGTTGFNLAVGGQTRRAQGLWVSGDFFKVLGVQPVLGRVFTPVDDRHGCGIPGAVISYPFWQREYGGQASAVGGKVTLDGHPVDIIGITPPTFFGVEVGRSFDVAVPLCSEPVIRGEDSVFARGDGWWLAAIGRLKPGWSPDRVTVQLQATSAGIFQATLPPIYNTTTAKEYLGIKLIAVPAGAGISDLRKLYESPLWLLLAIAGMVLLIACANLANLMFARATAREREIAVRLALGASRARLMQQLLVESLLLALIGAFAGILLAQGLTRVLVSFLSTQRYPVFLDLGLDWRVFAFTTALAVFTCLLFGLMPALRATRTSPGVAMKAGSRGLTATRERFGLRRILVVSQVALSLVLLVGALLFVRSFQHLLTLDVGFQQSGVLIANVDFSRLNIPAQRRPAFKRDLVDRLKALPGIDAVADARIIPLSHYGWNEYIHANVAGQEKREVVDFDRVSPGYFKTMGTPLLEGRDISDNDTLASLKVAVVTDSFARKFLNGADPIGKTFRVEVEKGKTEPEYQIVGMVRDTKYRDIREDFAPLVFLAALQDDDPDQYDSVVIRSSASLDGLIPSVEHALTSVNSEISIQFSVFKTQIRESLLRERLMASLSGFFGFLAGLLATIGLYGVISYMVARRRNEIGIRMALGADRFSVLAMIMREATVLLGIGIVIGTILAMITARTASAMLFGIKPNDPFTVAMAIVALAVTAIAASYLPAQRAAKVDPMVALRDE